MTGVVHKDIAPATIMVCLLFGTNFIFFVLFQVIRILTSSTSTTNPALISHVTSRDDDISDKNSEKKIDKNKDVHEKELSKPLEFTLPSLTKLTTDLFQTGLIMALTYIFENLWIFEHSTKYYSRDLFFFILFVFFAYALYTIQPTRDLTLLSREQTEEWKGWMQFIFLLYHYYHAEEVYNSVRVMITCYVWMTGFGNFSFFYVKQDYSWLRVVQMLWRLNFSVLLLMWTHNNTYILYYICPLHTFYFFMVYISMYIMSSINHSKWGIRIKLLIVGIIIYLIWDINGGLFDFLFAFLGTNSVIGASQGSIWEYYFRTSLDHYSSLFGMIFALNYPLAEQYFTKAQQGKALHILTVIMAIVSILWYSIYYVQPKLQYNLTHSYTAIIPLTAYIFFRNITPYIRSGISRSLHDLGKTTLETYLLQHHIWLTSNAKTLLTLIPNHPSINFAITTVMFFMVSKVLYRLTMSLRGILLPDDKLQSFKNIIGMTTLLSLFYCNAILLQYIGCISWITIIMSCLLWYILLVIVMNKFQSTLIENSSLYAKWSMRTIYVALLCIFLLLTTLWVSPPYTLLTSPTAVSTSTQSKILSNNNNNPSTTLAFQLSSEQVLTCQKNVVNGFWTDRPCDSITDSTINKKTSTITTTTSSSSLSETIPAYCHTHTWSWQPLTDLTAMCPYTSINTMKATQIYMNKKIVFIGDSIIRNTYHQFISLLDPTYSEQTEANMKHSDLFMILTPSLSGKNIKTATTNTININFIWAPFVQNLTSISKDIISQADVLITGIADWDALYYHDVTMYEKGINDWITSTTMKAISPISTSTDSSSSSSSSSTRNLDISESNLMNNALSSHTNAQHRQTDKTVNPVTSPFIIWLQPTPIINHKLLTSEKRVYMNEEIIHTYRTTIENHVKLQTYLTTHGGIVLNTTTAVLGREGDTLDGIHYTHEIYDIIVQMINNAYLMNYPSLYQKSPMPIKPAPKPKITGEMSFPIYGLFALILIAIMLFTMDSWLGFGYITLYIFQKSYDYESAYGPILRKIIRPPILPPPANTTTTTATATTMKSVHGADRTNSQSSSIDNHIHDKTVTKDDLEIYDNEMIENEHEEEKRNLIHKI